MIKDINGKKIDYFKVLKVKNKFCWHCQAKLEVEHYSPANSILYCWCNKCNEGRNISVSSNKQKGN